MDEEDAEEEEEEEWTLGNDRNFACKCRPADAALAEAERQAQEAKSGNAVH